MMNNPVLLEERQHLTDEQFWSEETKHFPTQAEWETLYKKDKYKTVRNFILNGDNLSPSTVKLLLQARDKGLTRDQEDDILNQERFNISYNYHVYDKKYPTIIGYQKRFDCWIACALRVFIETGNCNYTC